jgi:hypothetical protein
LDVSPGVEERSDPDEVKGEDPVILPRVFWRLLIPLTADEGEEPVIPPREFC